MLESDFFSRYNVGMNFRQIGIIVTDVDGCLTDGLYHVCEDGKVSKSFYTRDFDAIEKALKAGLKVIIITQSNGRVIKQKIAGKTWQSYITDKSLTLIYSSENKVKSIESFFQLAESWKNVIYLGDAENDVGCMKKAVYTACPSDAIEIIKENSNYISNYKGGKGFVYDTIMYLFGKIGVNSENSKA